MAEAVEIARSRQETADLESRLVELEIAYGMSSAEFMQRFQAGDLGDSTDMFEWSAYYHMWLSARERVRLLVAQTI